MPVFRWGQTWNAIHDIEREVDRLLRDVNLTFQGIRFGRQYPQLNLFEFDEEYQIIAELPGVDRADFDLTIANGVLTIAGIRRAPDDVPEDRYRRQERFHGSWQRTIQVPERVREEDLTAEFNNGILTVHLPKAQPASPRQIPVVDSQEADTSESTSEGVNNDK